MVHNPVLHLDFETFSECDLRAHGAHVYAEHPTTRVLCMAWRFDDGPLFVWPAVKPNGPVVLGPICFPNGTRSHTIVGGIPDTVFDHIENRGLVAGWNVGFEDPIWKHVLPRTVKGLPTLRPGQLRDAMAQAAYHGLPLSLDQASSALPALGIRKDRAGHSLMLRMSRPRTKSVGSLQKATWWHETDVPKLEALMAYCVQDVRTESAIERFLPELPHREQQIWQMDFAANARGIRLDVPLVLTLIRMAEIEKRRLDTRMSTATSGAVTATTQNAALTDWLAQRWQQWGKPPVTSLAKDKLPGLIGLAGARNDQAAYEALQVREEASKTSVAKAKKMLAFAPKGERMRGLTAYYGAFRTGRWAGRGPQIQNFPRPSLDPGTVNQVLAYLRGKPLLDGFDLFWGITPLEALKNALRGCLIASPDKYFASVDFSQIEARVLAWLAQEEWVLEAYVAGIDLYVQQAARIFGVPEELITSYQRQVGKVGVLALGYQGGPRAFEKMAEGYALDLSGLNTQDIVDGYRASVPRIKNYWYNVERAARMALHKPGSVQQVTTVHSNLYPGSIPVVQFATWKGHLLCKLPSGRKLFYRDAQIAPGGKFGGDVISYMGVNQYTKAWEREETYGGKLVENITQATARDILADAMLAADALPGVELLGSVHDEVLAEVRDKTAYTQLLATMKTLPAWAGGLPLDASGYVGERFGK